MASPTIYSTFSAPTLDNPRGLAIDYDLGRILIADRGNARVVLCKLDGLTQITTLDAYGDNGEYVMAPDGITYYNGYYYVCDNAYHTLVRIRARDLTYKDYFGTYDSNGSGNSDLDSPLGVTNDKQYLYIADSGNDRIMKLDLETLAYDSKTSNINGALDTPYGIVYKRKGGEGLFIGDANKVVKCQTNFTYIEQNTADVTTPKYMAFEKDYLHIVNGDDTIVVLSSDGLTSITSYTDTTLDTPIGIEITRDAMFISDGVNDRLSVWRRYNPRDAFTAATAAKFGGDFFDQPMMIVGEDSVSVGDTQEYGSPNRWKEENTNNYGYGWVEEDDVSSTWTEE